LIGTTVEGSGLVSTTAEATAPMSCRAGAAGR
jgi:hypothetical protein